MYIQRVRTCGGKKKTDYKPVLSAYLNNKNLSTEKKNEILELERD